MSKRPNKMGRIEGEPKEKFDWKRLGLIVVTLLVAVALPLSGILATLKYQDIIADIKAQGVLEFKSNDCKNFAKSFEDGTSQKWLECDL